MLNTKPNILIIDDEDSMLKTYKALLKNRYDLTLCNSAELGFLAIESHKIDAVLLDYMMPQINGIEVLKKIKESHPEISVVMVTAVNEVGPAVNAIKLGAYDYLTKPFEVEELVSVIEKIIETNNLKKENAYLKQVVDDEFKKFDFIGQSPAIMKIKKEIETIASVDSTVLITGETGTGKEVVAHSIHKLSPRKNNPFIAINCAAIPDNLLEAELFGHERGAYTGATERGLGKFELADNGTIFLDEIGCMSRNMQSKLLRVLETKSFERIGGKTTISSDVRIISATNTDFDQAIKEGKFRHDLFYRLNVLNIDLPSLNERKEDLPLLIDFFIAKFNKEMNKKIKGFTKEALSAIFAHDWVGNIRELKNLIERVIVLGTNNSFVEVENLPFKQSANEIRPLKEMTDEFERIKIKEALSQTKGNQTKAAELLGIHRTTLVSKIESLEVEG